MNLMKTEALTLTVQLQQQCIN